ncbi:hypothetical protein DEO72_LG6g2309 [Vigna unguiculata]|uniref:Uncharacterized protein n=1 Tax=Vigna unguiculata TaxID=3917 RepID=A0A4D6MB22_VIGUN|nr:hypothetical protein DEO72_LG6g2309 [Vigna unguiculata]
MPSKVCGCGERLLLLKASTVKNKGRLFWRCRNWTKLCVIFRNVIQSLWVWGKIVAPKGIYCEKQRRLFWRCRNWATNSHCNYFEWVDDEEFDFQGKETESEASGGKRVDGGKKGEEDEVSLKREKIMLDLMKKNEKLKMKLQQEKKIGTFLFILFVISPIHIVITLNGLTTRILIFKRKKKKVKPVVEKELMVEKKVKKMKFL